MQLYVALHTSKTKRRAEVQTVKARTAKQKQKAEEWYFFGFQDVDCVLFNKKMIFFFHF